MYKRMSKSKYTKKGRARKGRKNVRKSRVPRRVKGGVPEWASLTETREIGVLDSNAMYQSYNVSLSQFARARMVAQGYQQYRIKRIAFKVSPLLDTFSAGSNTSVPYLYYMIDRTKNLISANTVDVLQKVGAKPRRLDDKIVTFSYSPSVLTGTLDTSPPVGQGTSQFVQYKVAPWLNTRDTENLLVWNPDTTDHQGVKWMVESSTGTSIGYKMEMIVEFQFKKPSFACVFVEGTPPPVELEDLFNAQDAKTVSP